MSNLKHYIALLSVLSIGFGLFWIFNYDRQIQIYIVIGLGIIYVVWGTLSQIRRKEFYGYILLEYLAVALTACVTVIYLLSRA